MKNKKVEIPISALMFGTRDKKSIKVEQDNLDMLIYSGGLIKDHYYWGDLAIDLQGMQFPKSKYPILESHNTDRKIGFTAPPLVNGNLKIDSANTTFLDTPASQEFRRLSKEGFPYESSMYAKPTVIEKVDTGATSDCNGSTVKGPATIWRKSIFKEASVCTFGWDSQTEASAFSRDILELSVDLEGFDEDSELADRLFRLGRNGQIEETERLSEEDEGIVDELFSANGEPEEESLADDERIAQELFERTGSKADDES